MHAGSVAAFTRELGRAKQRFGLPADAPVYSCYEAGRDGYWVARWLEAQGVRNVMVDSSSIEVPRRARRTKTDRLDARKLVNLLCRYGGGDPSVWKVVRVPTVTAEDTRHVSRLHDTITKDRTRTQCRLRSLLATQGARVGRLEGLDVAAVRGWDGHPLPPGLQQRLRREVEQLAVLTGELQACRRALRTAIRTSAHVAGEQAQRLMQLRAVGRTSAYLFASEIFSWRAIRNGRQLGALLGLAPSPYCSGTMRHEQGITKAGHGRWRAMAIELAWSWLRYQPDSELTRWYVRRFRAAGDRAQKVGLVALARKLLIALWRYLETGVVPAGAQLKSAVAV